MKKVGCCTICDTEVFEIGARYPQDDPRAGQPRTVVGPFENALRTTYQLDNGSIMELTFCDACDPSDFERVMEIAVQATLATSRPGQPIQAYILERTILGILYTEKWTDIIKREVALAQTLRTVA